MTSETSSEIPWTLIAALVAATASIIGVALNVWNNSRSRRREALSEIASHRIRWCEELRALSAEFMVTASKSMINAESNESSDPAFDPTLERLYLMLSDREHSEIKKAIMDMRGAIIATHKKSKAGEFNSMYIAAESKFRDLIRDVLKHEWETSKSEIRGKVS